MHIGASKQSLNISWFKLITTTILPMMIICDYNNPDLTSLPQHLPNAYAVRAPYCNGLYQNSLGVQVYPATSKLVILSTH